MTTKYKASKDVPLDAIVARLKELSTAVTEGREKQSREFTMRIPAECDRDADLVIGEAANRIEQLRARVAELESTGAPEWVKRSDRTPEQSDGVKVWFSPGFDGTPVLVSPHAVKTSGVGSGFWKPTGLKRPAPPARQEGE